MLAAGCWIGGVVLRVACCVIPRVRRGTGWRLRVGGSVCSIERKYVGLWAGRGAEVLLEFLDDFGVGDAVEEHSVELVANLFWESGDFAATGAGGEEWIIGFVGLWIAKDVGGGGWFVVFCAHSFCVCFVFCWLLMKS